MPLHANPQSTQDAPLAANRQLVPVAAEQTHTSTLLQELIDSATDEHFTLEWLMGSLPKNSFGVIMLFLSLISLLPVISVVSRILLLILAMQIILGYNSPILPKHLTRRLLPSRYLAHLDRHAIPALKHLEKGVRPRLTVFLLKARRLTAGIAIILISISLAAPVPLANVPPAMIGILMSLSYIEHDGLLLLITLLLSFTLLALLLATFI